MFPAGKRVPILSELFILIFRLVVSGSDGFNTQNTLARLLEIDILDIRRIHIGRSRIRRHHCDFWKLPMEKLTIQIAIFFFSCYTIKPGSLRIRNRNRYITGLPEPVSLIQEPPQLAASSIPSPSHLYTGPIWRSSAASRTLGSGPIR